MALPESWRTAEDGLGPSKLYFKYNQFCSRAVLVKRAESGALVGIPNNPLILEAFHEAEEHGFSGDLGPFVEAVVPAVGRSGQPTRRNLDVLIFDLDSSGFSFLAEEPFPDAPDKVYIDFGAFRGSAEWPTPSLLAEAAMNFVRSGGERLEVYFSAVEEGAENLEEVQSQLPDPVQSLLDKLLTQADLTQRTVMGMQDRLSALPALEERLKELESSSSRAPAPVRPTNPSPQLFTRPEGGLDAAQLVKLQQLAGRAPPRQGDLGEGPVTGHRLQATPGDAALPGTTEGLEEGVDGTPLDKDELLHKLLTSQTAILQQLAAARAHSSDPLSVLLAGGAPDGEDYPKSSSVKGFAARQVLMDNFRRHPDRVLQSVRERLAQARRRPSAASLEARDLWYHFQESVPFGSHKTLTHVGFLAAKMWECSERDEIPQLRALVGLLAVFVEQAAFDNGGLRLAHLLTCAEDPPWSQTELHRAPRSEHACAQLADPKWVATQLAYLRDVETMQEKSNKFSTRPSASLAPPREERANPKWRPKNPRKSKGQTDPAEQEA